MAPEVLFKKEKICERLGISKEVFYELAKLPGCPIKKIGGITWACNLEELARWVSEYRQDEKKGRR